MVKSVLFCVAEGFESCKPAFEYASRTLVQEGDLLHIVTVMEPSDYVSPATGKPARPSTHPMMPCLSCP